MEVCVCVGFIRTGCASGWGSGSGGADPVNANVGARCCEGEAVRGFVDGGVVFPALAGEGPPCGFRLDSCTPADGARGCSGTRWPYPNQFNSRSDLLT